MVKITLQITGYPMIYYLPHHEVGVAGNILMWVTVHGIAPVSGICLSLCLQRRGRCHASHYLVSAYLQFFIA